MKRAVSYAFVILVLLAQNVWAQAPTNHWSSSEECNAAVEAPFYFPEIKNCKIDKKMFVELGLPSDSCVLMDLPDRLAGPTGYGWVKLEKGRRLNYNRKTGAAASLAECCNAVKEIRAIVPVASSPTLTSSAGSAPSANLRPTDSMKPGGGEGIIIASKTQASDEDSKDKKKSGTWKKVGRNILIGVGVGVGVGLVAKAVDGRTVVNNNSSSSCSGNCR